MSLDFCSKCGKYISANEGTIHQGVDNQPEVICDKCLAIAQTLSKLSVDMVVVSSVSAGFIAL